MKINNATYLGADGRSALIDLELPNKFNGNIILFLHGFMGFKDWGAWHLVQDYFVGHGFGFCKFNTSHNGGTVENGVDFPDPEAFGMNTYSKEIFDVKSVLEWLDKQLDEFTVHIIGHSKGGAVSLLCGFQFDAIKSVSTWASIASIGERFPEGDSMTLWKRQGVRYIKNGRTLQQLPQQIDLYEDYKQNQDAYDIESICKKYSKPIFIAHGANDTSVSMDNGVRLAEWTGTKLQVIPEADHVFESKHPWNSDCLPSALLHLCSLTADFIYDI